MFLDESGDHNLEPKKVDPQYPIFVLCGCIFDEAYYKNIFIQKFNDLKKSFFGTDQVILHTLEMTRPSQSKDKHFLLFNNSDFRTKFYDAINKLIESSEVIFVACIIKKNDHFSKYNLQAIDPYLLSFDNLLNRFIFTLNHNEKGTIIAERRESLLDNQLDIAWLNYKVSGTGIVKPVEIKEKIEGLNMLSKKSNTAGLQIADLIATPIGRSYLGKKARNGNEVSFEMLKKRFRKSSSGTILGYGVSIIPR